MNVSARPRKETTEMVGHHLRWGPREHVLHGIPGDYVTEQAGMIGTFYESDLLAWIHVRGREGVYIDVGAHVGNHSVFFAAECPSTRVIAVEPNPRAVRVLRHNLRDHWDVSEVRACAVHDRWRTVDLIDIVQGNAGMARTIEGTSIPCETLDALCAGADVAVIKVDVEGEEAAVVRSGMATIRRCLPLLAIEVNSQVALDEIEALILPLGYKFAGLFGPAPSHAWAVDDGEV